MNIDPGLIIVIVAVLFFYLRLIVLQRARARVLAQHAAANAKKKGRAQPAAAAAPVSIVSSRWSDRVIAGAGVLAMLLGILAYSGVLPLPLAQTYWWAPTALGIVAFSWLFKL